MDVLEPELLELPGDGLTLRAEALGPREGRPVLLVHGGGQTRGSWGGALRALAAAGYRAIAIDQRGHGESDWSSAAAYEPTDFGADLRQAVRALGSEPVVLVGASMGGWASLLAAPDLGSLVAGVVLVDITPRIRPDGAERVVGFMRAAPDGFADLEAAAEAISAYLPHRRRSGVSPGLRRNLRQRDDGRWVWHWDPAMVSDWNAVPNAAQRELEDAAARIAAPLMLIRGVLSDVVDDSSIAEFQALVPSLQVVDLHDAAHTAAADDNDSFVGAVLDFVRGLPA
ncbi:MAG: alpha/beta fold hydrolase [Sporichthyaceae bacterium]